MVTYLPHRTRETYKSFKFKFDLTTLQLEIVGDGYVVVSGLPKENGLEHGTEICKMALELMQQVKDQLSNETQTCNDHIVLLVWLRETLQ